MWRGALLPPATTAKQLETWEQKKLN
jgi:hypothetical protein